MRGLFTFLLFSFALGISAHAYNVKRACDENHMIIYGSVYEYDPFVKGEKLRPGVQIVVYQDMEIYVAFVTNKSGEYEFNLPLGHTYEIWYGGSEYVNKICYLDTREAPVRKIGNELNLDVELFKYVDGCDFSLLQEPFVKVSFDKAIDRMEPDLMYTEERSKLLDKALRKARRAIE
jgi:hypothetical protein